MPDRIPVQDLPLSGVAACGDDAGDPPLGLQQPLITAGQGAGRDQDAAQVRERLARRELVQDLVSQRAVIAAETGQERADGRQVQPGPDSGRPFDDGQGVMQRCQAVAMRRSRR